MDCEGHKKEKTVRGLSKAGATAVSLIVLFVIVAGLFWMVIPQIYTSIMTLQEGLGRTSTIWHSGFRSFWRIIRPWNKR